MVIFPKILIVLSLNPQYKSLFLFSTDETFRLGYLKFYFVQNVLLNKSNWARWIYKIFQIYNHIPSQSYFHKVLGPKFVFIVDSFYTQQKIIVIVALTVLVSSVYHSTHFLIIAPGFLRRDGVQVSIWIISPTMLTVGRLQSLSKCPLMLQFLQMISFARQTFKWPLVLRSHISYTKYSFRYWCSVLSFFSYLH